MPTAPPYQQDLDRLHRLLRGVIRDRGLTLRSVSRSLGWHQDYLSQLLRGVPRLRVDQLFEVLGVLGVRAGDFFAELALGYETPEGGSVRAAPGSALDGVLALIDARIEAALAETGDRRRASGEAS